MNWKRKINGVGLQPTYRVNMEKSAINVRKLTAQFCNYFFPVIPPSTAMKMSSFCSGDGPSSLPMGDNMDTGILNFKIYSIIVWLEACFSKGASQ